MERVILSASDHFYPTQGSRSSLIVLIEELFRDDAIHRQSKADGPVLPGAQEGDLASLVPAAVVRWLTTTVRGLAQLESVEGFALFPPW